MPTTGSSVIAVTPAKSATERATVIDEDSKVSLSHFVWLAAATVAIIGLCTFINLIANDLWPLVP